MTIDSVPPGSKIGIDATVLVYHVSGASAQCTELLARCERQEIKGFLPVTALAEALHRLMVYEAVSKVRPAIMRLIVHFLRALDVGAIVDRL